ncbi:hypothetical protein K8R42_02485 [bacterium]|nr:hypothetical protein [bacterium]
MKKVIKTRVGQQLSIQTKVVVGALMVAAFSVGLSFAMMFVKHMSPGGGGGGSYTPPLPQASLNVSVSLYPYAQTVVSGQTNFEVANFFLDASQSETDVKVTSVKPFLYAGADTYPNLFSSWELWVGNTELDIASSSPSMVCDNGNCNLPGIARVNFELEDGLVIPAGELKILKVKFDIGTGVSSGIFGVGIQSGGLTAVDENNNAFTPLITAGIGRPMTIAESGNLNVTILPDPAPALVEGGTTVTIGKFRLQTQYEGVDVNYLGFELEGPDGGIYGNQDEIDYLYLYDDQGIGSLGSVAVSSNNVTITPSAMNLDMNEEKTYTIKANFASLGDDSPASSGAGLRVWLNNIDATGISSGGNIDINGLGSAFNTFTLYKSIPEIAAIEYDGFGQLVSGNLSTLYKFKLSASPSGPWGLYKLNFYVSGANVEFFDDEFILFESSTTSTYGNIVARGGDFIVDFNYGPPNTRQGRLVTYLDVNDDNPVEPGKEHQILGPGDIKYYTLRAMVEPDLSVDRSVRTRIISDTAFAENYPQNADQLDYDITQNNLIWSDLNFDLYTTTTAPNTEGWFNGFRIPSLEQVSNYTQTIW